MEPAAQHQAISKAFTRRVPRILSVAALSVALVTPTFTAPFALSQDWAASSPALAALDPALKRSADDFWHYVQVARYDLANAEAKKLTAGEPLQVLRAFEAVASDRRADLDTYVARWTSLDPLKESAAGLRDTLDKGRLSLRSDQGYIEDNIKRLIVNERAYQLAVQRLRQAGELAVPQMVQYLRSPEQVQYHGSIRRALTDMGKFALAPLLAATESKDARVLTSVATVLGDMGYDTAVPYLLKLGSSDTAPASARQAAAAALAKLGANTSVGPADAFYQLGERFYYENALLTADLSQAPVAYVWFWSEDRGLSKLDVAPQIFNELMAMRSAEYSLGLNRGKAEALSLWLAANYKREVELPAGATDPTRQAGQPDAHYYGVAAGARYLNDVLARTLKDRNSAVALRAVKSLQEIVGQSSLFGNGSTTPLTAALSYPDRLVRFEAAYAIAGSYPQTQFAGSDQVIATLAEAVAQTGKPGIVVVAPTEEQANSLAETFRGLGYETATALSAEQAVNNATRLASVDAVFVSADVPLGTVDQLLAISASAPRLARTPKVIMTHTSVSPFASRAAVDVLVNTTTESAPDSLKAALDKARARGGANPQDEAAATAGALRSLSLLKTLAVSRSPVLDVVAARPTLISALDDARPEIIKSAADVLAVAGQREGQLAILLKATADKTPDDLRIPLLKSLATSAKTFGNQLPQDGIEALEKLVVSAESLDVRGAAAEARGALNLPPEDAKALIIKQARF